MLRGQDGFTLVEIMISLTVLGILIALGAPGFIEWMQSQRVRATAESITNGLQVARGEAIRRNLPVVLGLEPPGTAWTVCEATIAPCDSTTPAGNFIQNKAAAEASGAAGVTTTSNQPPTASILVTFSPLGAVLATNADGTPALAKVDVSYPPNVCSADGGTMRCLRVVVSPAGSVRMCDPTPGIVQPDPRACP